ncbi:hypothetical protein BLD44_023585 [Mastigocladus laminosus UU774]|nr:hypothetical protein BLD44_023585 [Mastigocladus laminosus UU774]
MINQQFDLINKSDIDGLIYNGVAETRTLEYKEKLPGNSDFNGNFPYFDKVYDPVYSIDRDILLIPEIVIEDYAAKASNILRPAFDAIWQACGWECCQNYDASGNWNPTIQTPIM